MPPGRRAIALSLGLPALLGAQELGVSAGPLRSWDPGGTTYAWQVFYRHPIRPEYELSCSWTNEGHLPDHHRDGCSLQVWRGVSNPDRTTSWAVGLGPRLFFDTSRQGPSHRNRHGVGLQATLEGRCTPQSSPWSMLAQVVAIRVPGEAATISFHVGSAFRFRPEAASVRGSPRAVQGPRPTNSLGFFAGRTILNSLRSETAGAWGLDYRHALSPHWSVVAAYTDEGAPALLRRHGLSLQAWIGGCPGEGKLHLGVGAGPHLARVSWRDREGEPFEASRRVGVLVSMGAELRVHQHWAWRFHWHRTLTSYDRDTDLLVTGMAYLW